jgi:hypothetical protein
MHCFPPVLILFDHPIGVTGLSIEQQAAIIQRMCEMKRDRLAPCHHPPTGRATARPMADDPVRREFSILYQHLWNAGCPPKLVIGLADGETRWRA